MKCNKDTRTVPAFKRHIHYSAKDRASDSMKRSQQYLKTGKSHVQPNVIKQQQAVCMCQLAIKHYMEKNNWLVILLNRFSSYICVWNNRKRCWSWSLHMFLIIRGMDQWDQLACSLRCPLGMVCHCGTFMVIYRLKRKYFKAQKN